MPLAQAPRSALQRPPIGAMLDLAHPLTAGLVGCWYMTEAGGSGCNDLTRRTGMISLQAGVTWAPAGVFGSVPVYGTTSKYGSFSWATTTRFSVEVWLYPTALPASGAYVSVLCESGRNGDSGSHAYGLNLFNFFGPTVVDWCGTFAHCRTPTSGVTVSANVWTQAVYVQSDANNGLSYINGNNIGTNTNIQTPVGTVLARVAMGGENVPFVGSIGLIRIWQGRALTAGDASNLYAQPYAMLQPTQPERRFWFLGVSAGGFIAPSPVVKSQARNRAATY